MPLRADSFDDVDIVQVCAAHGDDEAHVVATPIMGPSRHDADITHAFPKDTRAEHVLDARGHCPCNPRREQVNITDDDDTVLGTKPLYAHGGL